MGIHFLQHCCCLSGCRLSFYVSNNKLPHATSWRVVVLGSNDRTFPAADFQFVPVRVFEEERVIAWAVIGTDFGPFQISSAGFPHQFCNTIDFLSRIGPECDACSVRLVVSVLVNYEELRRLVGAGRIESMETSAGFGTRRWFVPFTDKPELRQKLSVKLLRYFHVFHSQINVIKATRFHFRFSLRTISFNPDQVSSIAHTFTSTNPSGSATARTTSSVTSVETPDDRFGQETQTVPVSVTFSRKPGNLFANSLRFLMKTWTKPESGFKRAEKVTLSGIVPSNRR